MELQIFIAETIKSILDGIKQAQEYAKLSGGTIVPSELNFKSDLPGTHWDDDGVIMEKIDFDVAVTVTDTNTKEGKAGISVWGIGAGIKGQENSKNESISRIKFSIPVIYPKQIKPKKH